MEIIDYLNNTVYCKLAPSNHGVGVFAIRYIPEGQMLTDYYGGVFKSYQVSKEEFGNLHLEIQRIIKQRTIFKDEYYFDSPNSHQIIEVFMNHSETPNSDGIYAIKDIKAGEEVTKQYNFIKGLNSDILNI